MTDYAIPLWGWIVIGAAIAVIVVLAFIAGRLLARLHQQQRRRQEAMTKRNTSLDESVTTLARAMEQGQCDFSEGALRIVVLLDHRAEPEKPDYAAKYPALHQMYERIKHMPTHDARKQFPKKEIRRMDEEREGYERELKDAILKDVRQLREDFREDKA
ncbi:DUF2489 domain-containing protein [Pseudidiomarina salinarum]|uniref:DUF2489 domain-containing protein n=1 Tax=Pseudidiomarina salinarum TaxID=435908 RepID=UPI00068D6684|nr:DUF2489 domain-containing protein [Pseudidiomarina salinarum]RUO71362.1 DUF2489 domain-containing protein [Pseudidiomarina salinarum]